MAARFVMAIVVMLLSAALAGCNGAGAAHGPPRERVTINGRTFDLELALDEPSRAQGLMNRESIPADGGMLFVFPRPDLQSFWMANCLVDIDVAFLDPRGRIVAIHTMGVELPRAPEESEAAYRNRLAKYDSRLPAQFAIELQAGMFERLGVRVWDRIELDLDRLKALAN